METSLMWLFQKLILLGMVSLASSVLETADMVDMCGRMWRGDALLLRSHPTSRKYYFVTPDTDCGVWVHAATPKDRIRFQFRYFLVYSLAPPTPEAQIRSLSPESQMLNASSPVDPCAPGSYLQFYDGPPEAPQAIGPPACGLAIPVPVTSSGALLGLRLVTRGLQPRVDFVGEVTSFRMGACGNYFRCGNGRCVPRSVLCDNWGMDNCGDGSDEYTLPPANCRGGDLGRASA